MAEELWADDEIICTNLAEQEIASQLNCTWHLSKLCAAWPPVFSRNSKYEQWWLHLTISSQQMFVASVFSARPSWLTCVLGRF